MVRQASCVLLGRLWPRPQLRSTTSTRLKSTPTSSALPGVTTPTGISCTTVRDPGSDLTAWTNSFQNIQCYDTLKVNAILNEIDGKNHLGTQRPKFPLSSA